MNQLIQGIPAVLIFIIFYVLFIRPQQKKAQAHRKMIESLRRGDHIVTTGGIKGIISKVEENDLKVEIAPNTNISLVRSMVTHVLAKPYPQNEGVSQLDLSPKQQPEKFSLPHTATQNTGPKKKKKAPRKQKSSPPQQSAEPKPSSEKSPDTQPSKPKQAKEKP